MQTFEKYIVHITRIDLFFAIMKDTNNNHRSVPIIKINGKLWFFDNGLFYGFDKGNIDYYDIQYKIKEKGLDLVICN